MKKIEAKLKPLLDLSKSLSLHYGDFDAFLCEALSMLGKRLEVARTSFWTYDEKKDAIINYALFDREKESFKSGDVLSKKDFPSYFKAFQSSLIVNADDAFNDPRTQEFKEVYLKPNNIKSMLDTQVWVDGGLFGVICMEHTNTIRHWNEYDEIFVTTTASYISQAYVSKMRIEEEGLRKTMETNYEILFKDSPVAMWVYEPRSYKILDANNAALDQYGYKLEEFCTLTLFDICSLSEVETAEMLAEIKDDINWNKRDWLHQCKDRSVIAVRVATSWTSYKGKKVRIAMGTNITEERKATQEKERLLAQLSDYAFFASHNLRAPVAAILGLIEVIKMDDKNGFNNFETLSMLQQSSEKLDAVIHEMHKRLE